MTDLGDVVVGLISLNKGVMAGKTRLQKTFFLLDKCGLGSGIDFDYHNFGPFSYEVATAVDDALAGKRLTANEKQGYYAIPYTLYSTEEEAPKMLGQMQASDAEEKLRVLEGYSALELEVAATIVFFKSEGLDGRRAVEETKARKPVKATDQRIARAQKLIAELGL
jgi:uncharacterized protein YwgA